MSLHAVGLVTEHRPYSGSKHLAALQLAEFANTEGLIHETIEVMAARATLSARQFRRILRDFEADGWVECVRRSAGGSGVASQYRLSLEWLRLPMGWRAGQHKNPDITRTKPGHNPDILTGFSGQKPGHPDRVFSDAPSSLKTLPPVVPHRGGSAVPSATPKTELDGKDLELARWMLGLIRELHPRHRDPNWKRWCHAIAAMRNIDGHSPHDIAVLFKRANADRDPRPGSTFCWAKVILSPDKLRAQWDKLTIEFGKPPPPRAESRLCEDCNASPWTISQQGQPKRCSACADKAERRAA